MTTIKQGTVIEVISTKVFATEPVGLLAMLGLTKDDVINGDAVTVFTVGDTYTIDGVDEEGVPYLEFEHEEEIRRYYIYKNEVYDNTICFKVID